MRSRDENLALRSLTAAVESNTESIKNLAVAFEARFDGLERKVDVLIDTMAEHIAHHGGES